MFVNVSPPLDGLKREAPQGYTRRRPRADGGIGRRARLRAWSGITGWRFESSSAHSEKPRSAGLFAFSGFSIGPGGEHLAATPLTTGEQPCSPVFSNREAAMSVHFDRVRGRWIVRWRDNGQAAGAEVRRRGGGAGLRGGTARRRRRCAERGACRAARGARRRPGRRLRVRDGGRHALAVRVPPVRRLADHPPRVREPRRRRGRAARRGRAGAARRGPCLARDVRASSGRPCSRPSGRT